ncbi:MAG: hypothetical protein ACOXZ9_04935 [Bacteroidales bacterium]|jgi:hypothetical protein
MTNPQPSLTKANSQWLTANSQQFIIKVLMPEQQKKAAIRKPKYSSPQEGLYIHIHDLCVA